MIKEAKENFTKYEIARILGARALQIAMDAPLLLKIETAKLDEIRYDPLRIAQIEFNSGVLPITVRRPFPKKIEVGLRRDVDIKKIEVKKLEHKEESDIKESGEIMELTQPEDEVEEAAPEEEGVEEAA